MDGWMMNRWMDESMEGWMNQRKDGWMHGSVMPTKKLFDPMV